MNYPNQLLLIEEYKYALNQGQHQAILIERRLLQEGLLDSSMEFIFTFGPLILDSIGGLIALTGVGIPLAGGIATAARGISIGGCLYFAYKLKEAYENDSFSDMLFSSLGLLFSAASAGVPGAGSLVGALSRGVVRSLEAAFGAARGSLKIAQASLDVAKNSKVYEGIGKAIMESKVLSSLSQIYSSKLMKSTIELLSGLATKLSEVTTTGISMIAKKLSTVIESAIPVLNSSVARINNFFQTLKYGKMAVITPQEMGLLAHTSFAQNVIAVSDDTALMISKHSKELAEPLSTAIRVMPKSSVAVSDDALNVIGRVRTKQMKQGAASLAGAGQIKKSSKSEINESLYLDELIWESALKSKIIKAQKMIDLI